RAELVFARGPGEGEALARQGAEAGCAPIVAVGGDGTAQEVANGLLATPEPPPLGLVPAGTGNVLARNLGLPVDPAEALRLIHHGGCGAIDGGLAGGRYFLNAAGAGLDAEAARAA